MKYKISALLLVFGSISCKAQTCTSNPTTISSNIDFSSISWTASGGATVAQCNAMASGTPFTGDVVVDIANNKTITVTTSLRITGDFQLTGGSGSNLTVTGATVHVYGTSNYMGDPTNNGVQYTVTNSTDAIIVEGTLYGKNNNAFTGNGSISGGILSVKNGSTCGSPCPISGRFSTCTSGDGFCSTYNVLPVKLIYFTGELKNEHVELSWATSMQENFDRFVIERSTNGIDFESIGEVKGLGFDINNITTEYTFTDENPDISDNYYRLKAIDLDEASEYFNVVSVKFEGHKKMWIAENPSDGYSIYYKTNFDEHKGDHVALCNSVGLVIEESEVLDQKNEFKFSERIMPGIYILKYRTAKEEFVARAIVR